MSPSPLIPDSAAGLWNAYTAAIGRDRISDFYETFHFHTDEQGARELADLVLAGKKRGTSTLAWICEHEGKPPPWPGCLSIVTDWAGTPLAIIETKTVEAVPFEEVTAEFAATEGEGDGSLAYWSEGHWRHFTGECAHIGKVPNRRMLVYCELFDVVFVANPRRTEPS